MSDIESFWMFLEHQERILTSTLGRDRDTHAVGRENITAELEHAFNVLSVLLNPEVILEIGAHGAEYSMRMKKSMPSKRVIAFEANPVVYNNNIDSLKAIGIEYINKAISDYTGQVTFEMPKSNGKAHTTMGSVLKHGSMGDGDQFTVDCQRLDDFLAVPKPSTALWIDVEGAAGQVIDGAVETIKAAKIAYLEIETRQAWEGQKTHHYIIEKMFELGMRPLARDIYRHRWQYNILFVNQDLVGLPIVKDVVNHYLDKAIQLR